MNGKTPDVPVNPYAPPRAEVAPPRTHGQVFSAFPRFSTWAVFGLAVITLSIYMYYWLYNRTQILNRILRDRPEDQISSTLVSTTLIFAVVNFLSGLFLDLAAVDPDQALGLSLVSFALSLTGGILFLVWVFKFRNRVNSLSGATSGDKYWASSIPTFFFSILYLSYKINQLIDRETRGATA